ncbi:interferon a3-like [Cheilinus undulatus]|uniref:interferon a3-like n=1 Tax=Cheilinus undulatus TaxID=241271 RepID=UPI001BD6B1ED|nr:interferon a3-like [Cheilinus undulatus]
MLTWTLCVCVFVCVFGAGSPLSCRWMDHKFTQFSENYLNLVDTMAHNSTNSSQDAGVAFPRELYSQVSKAAAEDKVSFTVQVLNEVETLFNKNHSLASWEEKTADDFIGVVNQQAEGLHSCIRSHSHKKHKKKLHMSFKRLSHVLDTMGHGAESWELIRKEVKAHLQRVDSLISSVLNAN